MKKKAVTTFFAGIGAVSASMVAPASAGASSGELEAPAAEQSQGYPGICTDISDVLCLFNGGNWRYGQVYDQNDSWNFGPNNNWNSKADVFMNNRGNQDACIYPGEGFTGTPRRVPADETRSWSNFGSSNKWVTPGAACPI